MISGTRGFVGAVLEARGKVPMCYLRTDYTLSAFDDITAISLTPYLLPYAFFHFFPSSTNVPFSIQFRHPLLFGRLAQLRDMEDRTTVPTIVVPLRGSGLIDHIARDICVAELILRT